MSSDEEIDYSDEEYEYDYSDNDDSYDDDVIADDSSMEGIDEKDNSQEAHSGSEEATETRLEKKFKNVKSSTRASTCSATSSFDNPNAAPMGRSSSYHIDSTSMKNSSCPVRLLEPSDLFPVMQRRVKEVTEVLNIPESASAVLMREHKWNKERLFESFYSDCEKLQDKCGVRFRCGNVSQCVVNNRIRSGKQNSMEVCQICTDEVTKDEMLAMPCGHQFCLDCWRGFAEVTLERGPTCVATTCPQAGCNEIVTEEEISVASPHLLPSFNNYQLRSFVDMNDLTRWCPGPGCTRIAIMRGGGVADSIQVPVECTSCSTEFCLKCGEEPHSPTNCLELARWNEKCKNESETANWILANTKPCPRCSSRIEKNQGCNHMACQQCKFEFCWICLGNWADHGANTGGYYKCNKYDPSGDSSTDNSDAAKAKRELDRYLHYYKRYHAHSEAQKFAKRQLRDTEAKMVLLQESTDNSTWTDVEFLKAATEQLVECRRVLKYTYSYAYYMTDISKKMHKERFEHHQEMLERFTENLSELSEQPIADMDRTDIVNQTRVVDLFLRNILQYVEDGMEED